MKFKGSGGRTLRTESRNLGDRPSHCTPGFVVPPLAEHLKPVTYDHIFTQIRCGPDRLARNYEVLQGNYTW